MENLHIYDSSNDKKYFTIIPNYILNHSTIWDREVYIQMKRVAGESGVCFMSMNTLSKQCGMSEDRLRKSIKYLLTHRWIEKKGFKKIGTKGGKQGVNVYRIVDLWHLNNTYYKGGASKRVPYAERGSFKGTKGGTPERDKEDPFKKKEYFELKEQREREKIARYSRGF